MLLPTKGSVYVNGVLVDTVAARNPHHETVSIPDLVLRNVVIATLEPAAIPAPTFDPADIFEGQELVTLETLVNGAHASLEEVGSRSIGSLTTPVSRYPNYMANAPRVGDHLLARLQLQTYGDGYDDDTVAAARRSGAISCALL